MKKLNKLERLVFIIALAMSLVSSVATAQDSSVSAAEPDLFSMDIEDLASLQVQSVYAASKFEQLTLKAPASVTIVTAEEIKRYGWRNFGEVLSSVRGFHVGFDRSMHAAGVRGVFKGDDFATNSTLVLIDGVRINEGLNGSITLSRDFPVDLDLIKRIEVVRGPGSVLYGSNAFLAVINVITKDADDIDGVELLGSFGSQNESRRRVTAAHTLDSGWSLTGSGTLFDRDGESKIYYPEFEDPAFNNGVAENLDGDEVGTAFFELAKDNFSLQFIHSNRNKGFSEAPFEGYFNTPEGSDLKRTAVTAQYTKDFDEDWNLQLKSSYNRFYEDGRYIYDNSEEGDGSYIGNAIESFHSQYVSGEALVSKKVNKMHTISFGTEYRRNFQQDIHSREVDIYYLEPGLEEPELVDFFNTQNSSNEVGLFTQAEIELDPQLFLTTGVRYDRYDLVNSNQSINPRAALVYMPQEETAFKLNYSTAFRAPSGIEYLYNDADVTQKAPTALDPEEITNYEFVVEHYFDKNFSATVSTYYSELENSIGLIQDPADELFVFTNADEQINVHGFEFGLEKKWDSGWRGRGSYSYQETEDEATGAELVNSPNNLVKFNILAPLIKEALFLGYELQYADRRWTYYETEVDDYWVSNVTLSSEDLFLKGLNLQLSAYNLLNQDISNPGTAYQAQEYIPNEGRTYLAEAMYKF